MRPRRGASRPAALLPLLLLALVGIVGTAGGLASAAYPSDDQYSLRNHYRIASQADSPSRDYQEHKDFPEKTSLLEFESTMGYRHSDNEIAPVSSDLRDGQIIDSALHHKALGALKKILGEPSEAGLQLDKRSNSDEQSSAPTLQELLKLWGIEEPTKRPQRGDIEVTERALPRGDAPSRRRNKRWANEQLWGFAEDDGLLMSDQQASEDEEDYQSVKRPTPEPDDYQSVKRPDHHRKRPTDTRYDDEARRMAEQERRRIEQERRRNEEAQARRDEEARRLAEERRSQDPRHRGETKQPQDPRHRYETKQPQDPRHRYETKQPQDPRHRYETKEPQDPRHRYETKQPQDPRHRYETKEPQDLRNRYETKQPQDPRHHYETKEPQDPRNRYETKQPQDPRHHYGPKLPEDPRYRAETKQPEDPRYRGETKSPVDPRYRGETEQPLDPRHHYGTKQPQDPRHRYDTKQPQDPRHRYDTKQPQDPRHRYDTKQPQDPRHGYETKQPEDPRYRGETKQPQELRHHGDTSQPSSSLTLEDLMKMVPQGETYEERIRDWHRMKDEYERLARERQMSQAPEELNRNQPRARSQEDLDRERKLKDYIDRNTPIRVGSQAGPANSREPASPGSQRMPPTPRPHNDPEMRRKIEECRSRYNSAVGVKRGRSDEENEQVRRAEHERRLEEECRRRIVEEQGRRYEEERRRHSGVKARPSPQPSPQPSSEDDVQRTIAPELPERPRQPDRNRERDESRRSWSQPSDVAPGQPASRAWDDESNRRRYLEFKRNEASALGPRAALLDKQPARSKEEEDELRRIKGMPVSARIIVRPGVEPNGSATPAPLLSSRLAIGEDIDFPGLNPNRGVEAVNFPSPPTPRPPTKSPEPCVWAIVVCCQGRRSQAQLARCFEGTNCPGASWDASTCEQRKLKAANDDIMRFYLSGRARF